MTLDENILKTHHSLDFALGDLQQANAKADAVLSLLLLDCIELVATARKRIMAIENARGDCKDE